MNPKNKRDDRTSRRPRSNALRASLEGLEERLLLYSTLGGQWVFGERITYSFAPDGTNVAGRTNNLHQAMSDRGIAEVDWKNAFRKAAATWQAVAGINLVEVPDNGALLGGPGYQQGDPRFGDIRIFGVSDEPHVLAGAFLPPPMNGGTRAGDIIFNTNQPWTINTGYDIMSVAVHEFGHSLGLDHTNVYNAVMYQIYSGMKQTLHNDDIEGIQSLYGVRQPDYLDAWSSNSTYLTASNLSGWVDSNAQLSVPNLDISTLDDRDWIYVAAPANAVGTMTITVQATGLSSLSPRVDVYNAWLQYAGSAFVPDPANVYGGTASISYSGVPAGTGVYLRIGGWNLSHSGPNGVGTYGLQVNFGSQTMAPFDPPNTMVEEQLDLGRGFSNLETYGPETSKGGFNNQMNGRRDRSEILYVDPAFQQRPGFQPPGKGQGRFIESSMPLDSIFTVSPDTKMVFPRPGQGQGPLQNQNGRFDSTAMVWLLPTPAMDAAIHQMFSTDQDKTEPGRGRSNSNARFSIDDLLS